MKSLRFVTLLTLILFCLSLSAGIALSAEKIPVKGKISGYDLDARTVTITADDGKEMTFTVESDKALQKLDDRLFTGDEVKVRYTEKDGKKLIRDTNDLRGTKPGC
ncbi:MAG: DUF1344 domain-containing protein [Thermodesulfovibrionales bacterium]